MRKALAGTGLAMIVALAGCGPSGPATPENVAITVPDSADYQRQLTEMNEGARNAVFFRAVQDAGHRQCQHVRSSSHVGDEQGFPVWQATCQDGSMWKILIANDGVAQVTSTAPDPELGIGGNGNFMAEPGEAGAPEVSPVDNAQER
jgi:predicted small lipoprotein YifL